MTDPVVFLDSVKPGPSIGKRRRDELEEFNDDSEGEPDDNDGDLNGDDGDLGYDNPYHDGGDFNGNDDAEFESWAVTVAQTSGVRQAPGRNDKAPCSRAVCSLLRVDIAQDDTILLLLYLDKPIFVRRFSKLLTNVYMKSKLFENCLEAGEVSVSCWTG